MASILRREPHKDSATVNCYLSLLSLELVSIHGNCFLLKAVFSFGKQVKKFCPKGGAEAAGRGDVEEAVDDVEEEDEEAKKGQQGIRDDSISEKRGKNSRAMQNH